MKINFESASGACSYKRIRPSDFTVGISVEMKVKDWEKLLKKIGPSTFTKRVARIVQKMETDKHLNGID